jgi:hypothetical protein
MDIELLPVVVVDGPVNDLGNRDVLGLSLGFDAGNECFSMCRIHRSVGRERYWLGPRGACAGAPRPAFRENRRGRPAGDQCGLLWGHLSGYL